MELTVKDIIEGSHSIDTDKLSCEMLDWMAVNVETYIDNKETVFLLYFTKDSLKDTPILKEVYRLYQGINENWSDEDVGECFQVMDAMMATVKEKINANAEKLEVLFKRMIYFYDMQALISDGTTVIPIINKLVGSVMINEFLYEPIKLNQIVKMRYMRKKADGSMEDAGMDVKEIKNENTPEGFALEVELMYWQDTLSGMSF